MFVNGSGWIFVCFGSFGQVVSKEKIKMWKVNGRRMPSDDKSFNKVS